MSVHLIYVRRFTVESVLEMVREGFELVPVVRCSDCGNEVAAYGKHICRSDEATVRQLLNLAANTIHPSPGLDRIRRETQAPPTPSDRRH